MAKATKAIKSATAKFRKQQRDIARKQPGGILAGGASITGTGKAALKRAKQAKNSMKGPRKLKK